MNIHYIRDSIYTKEFIKYINTNFNINDHIFICITKNPLKYLNEQAEHVILINLSLFKTINKIRSIQSTYTHNKIFIHYLSDTHLIPILLAQKKDIITWFVWGGDFYSFVHFPLYEKESLLYIYPQKKYSIKSFIKKIIRNNVIRRFNYIGINSIEYSLIKKYYKTNAYRINFKYPNPVNNTVVFANNNDISVNTNNSARKRILLGNSGAPENNHISIIKKLSSVNEDFEVIVPLSYGNNSEYIKEVIRIGEILLKNKFKPLLDFLPTNEYVKILNTVDIAIMNHYRQQAAGNLRILISLGKKIYVNKVSPLYEYYTQEGVFLNTLQDCIFDESIFISYSDEVKFQNKKAIEGIYSKDKIDLYMNNIFA